MSRANPFGDLDDFGSDNAAKPVPAEAIEKIAESSGFPSRKAGGATVSETASQTGARPSPPLPRKPAARRGAMSPGVIGRSTSKRPKRRLTRFTGSPTI